MSAKQDTFALTADTVIKGLNKRNMRGFYAATKEEATKLALSLMKEGSTVSAGGSVSIKECGLLDAVRSADYDYIDRNAGKTQEETDAIYAKVCGCDYFLMGTNAITLDGELVNIDGMGNRVAPLIYGPKNIIIICGMNKLAKDIDCAYERVKVNACPPNAVRLNRNVPCAVTGACADCLSPDCFCNQIVITRRSGIKDRITVILVGEELGF